MSRAADHDQAINLQGHYAGAITRLAAYLVDQTVVVAVYSATTAVAVWTLSFVTSGAVDFSPATWFTALTYSVWWLLYFAYPWSVSGKTFGMALLGIRVVGADGSRCRPRQAAARAVTFPLGFVTLGLGFLPILTGRHRRAVYDLIAGTAVVYAWDARAARWRFLARRSEEGAAAA